MCGSLSVAIDSRECSVCVESMSQAGRTEGDQGGGE